MFHRAFNSRRCLVPADGFYEWRKEHAGGKQPMLIEQDDGEVFAFAGLWETWRASPDADPLITCTIITTTPNPLMASIHDRMPVILSRDDYARWIDPAVKGPAVADLLRPYPEQRMRARPVATIVNSPRNDDDRCVAPLA